MLSGMVDGQPMRDNAGMKKTTAIKKAGSAYKLAKMLGISKQAVSKWPEKIPEQREAQLRESNPKWFRQPAKPIAEVAQ